MSLAKSLASSMQAAKSLPVFLVLKASLVRNWASFTKEEKALLNRTGQEVKARLEGSEQPPEELPTREPSDNMPGEYAYKPKGMPKGEVMHKSFKPLPPVLDEPAEMPHRANYERLLNAYQVAPTREQIRAIRAECEELSRSGQLMIWQFRELFVSDISALRRVWEEHPPEVSERTQLYLDRLAVCQHYDIFYELLQEIMPYSLELERANSREWWDLEHAFELKSAELKHKTRAAMKNQKDIPF